MNINKDVNSYKELKKPTIVTCDFCEKEFKNRYDSIIHNASHIIIPLWIQSFHKCDICNIYTTSLEDLETHNSSRHTLNGVTKNNGINKGENFTLNKNKNEEIGDIIQKYELEINGNDESDIKQIESEPIRNRLKFEEDVTISNGLMKDLVTDCQVNIQACDPSWTYQCVKHLKYMQWKNDTPASESTYTSIDYDSLMKPGIFNCKYCSKSYPNRFSLIQHEMCHIKITKGKPNLCIHCDKFIAGNEDNLNLHNAKYHSDSEPRKCETFICKHCGLRFRKHKRHVRNYHIYDCRECCMEFHNAKQYADHVMQHVDHRRQHVDRDEQTVIHQQNLVQIEQNVVHVEEHTGHMCNTLNVTTKLINVCDLCYSFLKRRVDLKYYLIGETQELGVRYPCDNCGKKYFALKIVKRIQKVKKSYKDHKNRLTNEERLKNIQHRLKKLNLMNKFYFAFDFITVSK